MMAPRRIPVTPPLGPKLHPPRGGSTAAFVPRGSVAECWGLRKVRVARPSAQACLSATARPSAGPHPVVAAFWRRQAQHRRMFLKLRLHVDEKRRRLLAEAAARGPAP